MEVAAFASGLSVAQLMAGAACILSFSSIVM